MAREDIAAGRIKQSRGKANDIVGAATGRSRQQAKGKLQKAVGAVQEKLGKLTTRRGRATTSRRRI